MRMQRLCLGLFAIVILQANSMAQVAPDNPDAAVHTHSTTVPNNQVDGTKNPELIPDLSAYRLFFVAAATTLNPSEREMAQQRGHVGKIGLRGLDVQYFREVLAEFKSQYEDLIKSYNESVEVARSQGIDPDFETFLVHRDALVQATRDRLKALLTVEGSARLDALVQREKRNMKVSVPTNSSASSKSASSKESTR